MAQVRHWRGCVSLSAAPVHATLAREARLRRSNPVGQLIWFCTSLAARVRSGARIVQPVEQRRALQRQVHGASASACGATACRVRGPGQGGVDGSFRVQSSEFILAYTRQTTKIALQATPGEQP